MENPEKYIILENVNKTLKKRQVLKDINLCLEKGKIYGFFGRNASGKSMLFRAVSGLITIDSGTVRVFGKEISKDRSFPDSMGIIIENIGLWKNLTGIENLELIAEIKKTATREDMEKALIRVGLDPEDKRKYRAYSLGMKQKMAIAQAIMEKPELLILDEPTNGLDDEAVKNFQDIIREEKEKGTTCLIATHQKEDIMGLCDEVFEIKDGMCSKKIIEERSSE